MGKKNTRGTYLRTCTRDLQTVPSTVQNVNRDGFHQMEVESLLSERRELPHWVADFSRMSKWSQLRQDAITILHEDHPSKWSQLVDGFDWTLEWMIGSIHAAPVHL